MFLVEWDGFESGQKLSEAQKETFELINTVKQLKETVATLAPILKQGKSILSSLEALKV